MTTESFVIEAEGKSYRQQYLSSEDGIRLQLWVSKVGMMPLLQSATALAGSVDTKELLSKIASDAQLQGQLLGSLYNALQSIEFDDIKMLKDLLFPVTYLQRPQEQPAELQLSLLPKHFNTIADNARLYVLLFKSIKVQLAPLLNAQFISQISAQLKG